MHANPKIQLRKRRCADSSNSARPQTKLRTDRKLPVLYYISYGYVFTHTNHHSKKSARAVSMLMPNVENATSTTILKSVGHDKRKHGCHGLSAS